MTESPLDPLSQAEELLRSGYKEEASALLERFLNENPDSARGWWLMSFATKDFNQQFDCLERVLELHPNHRKARERLAALTGEALSGGRSASRIRLPQLSRPVVALIVVFGCVGLMVIGYFGYRRIFPAQTTPSDQAEIAQMVAASLTAAFTESGAAPAGTSTLTPLPAATQASSPEVTITPLVSITPTSNPDATRTPIPESLVGIGIGQYPPDFTLINAVTNAEVNLRDYVGQPVILVFLNTMSPECGLEMPGLEAVYQKYQNRDLAVLGIGVGASQSALRTYTGRFGGLSFPLLSDWEHDIARLYQAETTPTNYIIRKNGKIWQISVGVMTEEELDTAIASVLKVP